MNTIENVNQRIIQRRTIEGIPAVLLPFDEAGKIDFDGFTRELEHITAAGLTPSVNMDTGYVNLLSADERRAVLEQTRATLGGKKFIAGAFIEGEAGDPYALSAREVATIQAYGGTPILFQCSALKQMRGAEIVDLYRRVAAQCETMLAFELGEMFAPFGQIYNLDVFRGWMEIPQLVGSKHSSLDRELEWQRLALRDEVRPDFKIYTGNDLGIDMVMYGSDYLLGLASFAPDAFARRDAYWANGDARFYALNDLLQYLGFFAFRPPVPGYKHNAAMFLKLRGKIATDCPHPNSVRRPESDVAILSDIAARLEAMLYMPIHYTRVAQLKTPELFAAHLNALGVDLPFDAALETGAASPLAQPYALGDRVIGNRFCVQPMEGWDAETDGNPTALTRRRWENFGKSGAKLIWGGEAVAVRHDGRANPNQLMLSADSQRGLADLRAILLQAHHKQYGSTDDLLIGLQLTHSGRFSKPNDKKKLEPFILYAHPLLNRRYGLPTDYATVSDMWIDDLIGDFVTAARRAQELGFDFVDLKHCHGYLGHEFLSAVDRAGKYGGSFENRTRFLRELAAGVRRDAPGLEIGVRVSIFDLIPYRPGADGRGVPDDYEGEYRYAFGGDACSPTRVELQEPLAFLQLLQDLDIRLVNLTAGSPYYNPHVQRPALFPPSDGYEPPEDPLVGVARQINVTAQLKQHFPQLAITGTGYSYLQEWLPNVGQYNVRTGRVDFVGLGRMILAYPEMPADVLAGKPLRTKFVCRTFSDCTTGPRNGLVSGCFPLDPYYKSHPEHEMLKAAKRPA